jgi:hypothetical protein
LFSLIELVLIRTSISCVSQLAGLNTKVHFGQSVIYP